MSLTELTAHGNGDRDLGLVAVGLHGRVLNGTHNLHALHDLTEDHVLAIEPLARVSGDEELTAVRVRTAVRHRHQPCAVVTQRERLVLERLFAIYGQ